MKQLEIFKVFGSVFLKGADKTEEQLENIDKQGEKTGGTFDKMGQTFKKGAKVVGTATLAAGTALIGMAKKGADATDRIDKLSQRLGLSRKGFQEWDFILSQAGVNIESMQAGMKNLSQRMDESLEGAGRGAEIFEELGLKITESMTQEEAFNATVTALQNMEDGVQKAALAQELFGRSGQELLPLLNGTAASVEELRLKANELGLVMSDTAINSGVQLTDSMDQVTRSIQASATSIISELMPTFIQILDWVVAHMPEIQSGIETAVGIATTMFKGLSDGIKFLIDNANILIPILSGVVAGIVAFQIIDKINKITALWTTITQGQTVAQGLLNAIMNANPIGLVVIAIGALVAAGVLLWKNWDTVKAKAKELWASMKDIFSKIGEFVSGIWTGIVDSIKASIQIIKIAVNTLINVVKQPINALIGLVNKFIGGLNKIKVPNWVPRIGGRGINIPKIPRLAEGGDIVSAGRVLVGEEAPEILDVKPGARVTPLDKAMGNGEININIGTINTTDKEAARKILREVDRGLYNKRRRGKFA